VFQLAYCESSDQSQCHDVCNKTVGLHFPDFMNKIHLLLHLGDNITDLDPHLLLRYSDYNNIKLVYIEQM